MAIAFRSASTQGSATINGTNSLTVTKPAGTADGDLLVLALVCAGSAPPPTPSGWFFYLSQYVTFSGSTTQYVLATYLKFASGEPASWTFAVPNSNVAQAMVASYTGAWGTYEFHGGLSLNTTGKARRSPGGATTSQNDAVLRIAVAQSLGATPVTSWDTLAGYTRRVNRNDQVAVFNNFWSSALTMQDTILPANTTIPQVLMNTNVVSDAYNAITIALPSADTAPGVPVHLWPPDGTHADLTQSVTFAWNFVDVDAGDTQSAWAMRRKIGAGAYSWYTVGSGWGSAVEVFNTGSNPWVTFPVAQWTAATTYLWSVSVKDSHGVVSGYGTDTTAVVDSTFPTPTLVLPESEYIGSKRPIIQWTTAGSNKQITQWRVKIFTDAVKTAATFNPDSSASVWDSGLVTAPVQVDLPPYTMIPDVDLSSGIKYWVYLLYFGSTLQSSGWTNKSFSVAPIAYPAAVPILTAAAGAGATGPRVDLTANILANLLTLDQSTLENSTIGWKALSNCTISRDTTYNQLNGFQGDAELRLTASSGATCTACTNEGRAGIPVVVGQTYKALALFRGLNFTGRLCRLGIRWYDGNGVLLSTSFTATQNVSNTLNFNFSLSAAAPANSVFAALVVEAQTTVLNEALAADMFYFGNNNATVWTVGGTIYGNLLDFESSQFETPNSNFKWFGDSNLTVVKGFTSTYAAPFGAVNARTGCGCLAVVSQYAGNTAAIPTAPGNLTSPQVAIANGQVYTGSAWVRPYAARTVLVYLNWYDSSGNLISQTNGADNNLASGSYQQVFASGLAPSTAAYVAMQIAFYGTAAGDRFDVDDATITFGYTLLTDMGSSFSQSLLEIQASDDGISWIEVRGAAGVLPDLSDLVNSVSDYEAPVGAARKYRARTTSTITETPARLRLQAVQNGYCAGPNLARVKTDLDVRVKMSSDDGSAADLCQRNSLNTTAQIVYDFQVNQNGLTLLWVDSALNINSESATVGSGFAVGQIFWARCTLQGNVGGVYNVKFYTSLDGLIWTQLGTTKVGISATQGFNAVAAPIEIGTFKLGTNDTNGASFNGSIYYFEVRDGIGGPIVLAFDPTKAVGTNNSSPITDSYGNVFTINGGVAIMGAETDACVWTPSQSATPASTGDWWLKDPVNSAYNMKLYVDADGGIGPVFDTSDTNAKYDVLNRSDWVVFTDTWKGDTLAFKSKLFATDYASFELIRKNVRPLLLQSDYGPQWYVAFDQRTRSIINTVTEFQELDLNFIQVARPPV